MVIASPTAYYVLVAVLDSTKRDSQTDQFARSSIVSTAWCPPVAISALVKTAVENVVNGMTAREAPVVAVDCDVNEIWEQSLLNCSLEETVTDTITRIVDGVRVDLAEIIQQRQG